jgi:Stigma-specific protein, Stig1
MAREPSKDVHPPWEEPIEGHSFDELARGLASGTISRGRALKWVGAAFLAAAVPPLFPAQAVALTRRQRRRCRNLGGTVCGEVQRSQICCPSGLPCCGTARRPVCCPSGGQCVGGSCQCPSGETDCSGACVNLNTDENNCGTCGATCSEGASCVDGSCECPTGESDCNNRCVDLNTDESNCGTCGNQCPEGASCVDGSCEGGQGCPPGEPCGSSSQCACIMTEEGTSYCTSATGLIICDAMHPCTSSAECPEGWACSEGHAFGPCPGPVCWPPCEG